MQLASMKLKNERNFGVAVTRYISDLNLSQNISNVTGNSGDLSRDISNLRHAISKEPEYQQFSRIIIYLNTDISSLISDIRIRISAILARYQQSQLGYQQYYLKYQQY
jgi:hypothetical protein